MQYPQEVIEEVRMGNDIVDVVGMYVPLRSRGGRFWGSCPFHNESTPSFNVSADTQMYYCFGCGAGGTVITFIMQIENYDFLDALKFLAGRIHYTLPQAKQTEKYIQQRRQNDNLQAINKAAARFYHDTLLGSSSAAKAANKYLEKRGLHPKLCKKFGLGLSPDWDSLLGHLTRQGFKTEDIEAAGLAVKNQYGKHYDRFHGRLIFPILDINGQVSGFGGREMDGKGGAKYLNSPETPLFNKSRQLYGAYTARKARPGTSSNGLIIVEGYMDVLAMYQAGFANVCGVLGTALTPEHARLVKKLHCEAVTLLPDSDAAGVKAALKAIPVLTGGGIKVKVAQAEDAKDPDEYLQKHGPHRMAELLQQAKSHIAFRVDLLRADYDLTKTEQRILFTQEAARVLGEIDNPIEADAYIRETSGLTGVAVDAIKAEVERVKGTPIGIAPRDRPNVRYALGGKMNEKGLTEARKGLVSTLLAYPAAAKAVLESRLLAPQEMGDPMCVQLLEIAYSNAGRAMPVTPAEAVARFEGLDEQRQAAELLKDAIVYENDSSVEKEVNRMLKHVKHAWLVNQFYIEQENERTNGNFEANTIKTLQNATAALEKQYITITNG